MHRALALTALAQAVAAQNFGTLTPETHPKMPYQVCDASGCTTEQGEVVLDSNWRWLHTAEGSENCYDANVWVDEYCPDGAACAEACALEGAEYETTYGVTTPEDGTLKLQFVTEHEYGSNVGSRVYLMESEDKYKVFDMLNKEITFDVDVSALPCGLNGAVYFSEMEADGGMASAPGNKAGAKYGTGYCDSQCPQDIKFINGEANVEGWGGADDANAGLGKYGTCCAEMDLWEANLDATAYTPHPCDISTPGQKRCEGTECGAGEDRYSGLCDKDGCDFNSMRMGVSDFYGPGMTLDTGKPMTVVTQFLTDDGTDAGELSHIKRFYVQDGRVVANSDTAVEGIDPVNHISADFCSQQKSVFGDTNHFEAVGGLARMGQSMRNMVLVLSIWDDHAVSMNWLDSHFPTDADPSAPGVTRGRCDPAAGEPATVEKNHPDAYVIYSNIKYGTINSTFTA